MRIVGMRHREGSGAVGSVDEAEAIGISVLPAEERNIPESLASTDSKPPEAPRPDDAGDAGGEDDCDGHGAAGDTGDEVPGGHSLKIWLPAQVPFSTAIATKESPYT